MEGLLLATYTPPELLLILSTIITSGIPDEDRLTHDASNTLMTGERAGRIIIRWT